MQGCRRMTRRIDLTGERFGYWTVLRHTKKRDTQGRRSYCECRCKCGRVCLVKSGQLRSGVSKSCGCRRPPERCGRHFNKKLARDEDRANSRFFVDGRWWLSLTSAKRYLDVDHSTLYAWREKCPWLGGQGIETRRLSGRFGRLVTYYAHEDLDRINEAKARHVPIPELPGYVHVEEAARELGWNVASLRHFMKRNRVPAKKASGKSRDGRARLRYYAPLWLVEQCKADRSGYRNRADKLTIREAADVLATNTATVHGLIRRGALHGEYGRAINSVGHHRRCVLLQRADVEAWKRKRHGADVTVTANGHADDRQALVAPTISAKAAGGEPVASAEPLRRKRGRPKGKIDPVVARRNQQIQELLRSGKYASKAELARMFRVDRKTIYDLID